MDDVDPRNWLGDVVQAFQPESSVHRTNASGSKASTKTTLRSYLAAHAFATHWGRDPIVGRADAP